jgi:uncharacterized C2H2 Zn-finger protein
MYDLISNMFGTRSGAIKHVRIAHLFLTGRGVLDGVVEYGFTRR